jgi:translation initiation factor IF-2
VQQLVRTAQVAKHLGISSRQLREFLSEVNFGIRPTDREMPITIAAGVVRYVSHKLKIPYVQMDLMDEGIEEDVLEEETAVKIVQPIEEKRELKQASFSTLQKLQGITSQSKEDVERRKKQEEEKKDQKKAESSSAPKILRKIEISPEAAEQAKKRHELTEMERRKKAEEEAEALLERKLLRNKRQQDIFKKKEGVVELPLNLSIKEFSEKIGIPVSGVIASLLKNGIRATITESIDFDTASIIADELEVQVKKTEGALSTEELIKGDISQLLTDDPANLVERPPVVVVMGHVDHGKTSILDAIRKTKVVAGEAGGITQHIGAYQVEKNGRKVTFLDTPGHEAFTSMRARGARTADIAILVVAADEGLKPQTIEAINHAKAAHLPIIVALNKIDKPNINPDRVKGELTEHDLQPEDWGGKIPLVPVSAITGQGIEDLIEIVLLQADVLELKANPNRLAVGTVVEAHLDPALGPIATILINTGTMKVRDFFLLGSTWGRVKTMINDDGKRLKEVGPSMAARISGIEELPSPGDIFQILPNEKEMKKRKAELENILQSEKKPSLGMAEIVKQIRSGQMKFLNLVIKADTTGSLEAIRQALSALGNEEVRVKILHSAVGAMSENDVMMASASGGILIGFHVKASAMIRQIAEREGIEIRFHQIIYDLIEEVKGILEGLLEPEKIEIVTGELIVKGTFYTKGKLRIIGGRVEKGYLQLGENIRVFRKEELLCSGKISGLQHFEEKIKEVKAPQECGLQIETSIEIIEGDRIEAFTTETRLKKL